MADWSRKSDDEMDGTGLKLTKLPINAVARFLREWLPERPSLFGGLAALNLESGDSIAWLDAAADPAGITNLNWGGVVARSVAPDSRNVTLRYVDQLAEENDLCLIALDAIGAMRSPDADSGMLSLGSGGWDYLISSEHEGKRAKPSEVLMELGMTYPLIAVLCHKTVADWLWRTRASDPGAPGRLAGETRCIVFGAFDAESYAIWLPDGEAFREPQNRPA